MCTSVVFSSLSFLYIFLPICLLGAFALPKLQWKNYFLLAMSLFFYAWGEPKWILLMIISTAVEYAGALVVDRNRGTWKAKAAVGVSVGVALTFLFIFKYLDFFTFNFNTIFHTNAKLLELTLPIGISFYTFQTITYIVDVYRDKAPVQKNFGYMLLYVSMFPQLIAGPIVKYVDIEAQIRKRTLHGKDVGEGVLRFLTGLFKKAVLANVAGEVASTFLDGNLSNLSVLGAWLGILSYTLQIYFDFSAYSDMAIGLGRIFGFRYKENFNYPYIANSITDFWRRWHISLTTFFREYLYIPLGILSSFSRKSCSSAKRSNRPRSSSGTFTHCCSSYLAGDSSTSMTCPACASSSRCSSVSALPPVPPRAMYPSCSTTCCFMSSPSWRVCRSPVPSGNGTSPLAAAVCRTRNWPMQASSSSPSSCSSSTQLPSWGPPTTPSFISDSKEFSL